MSKGVGVPSGTIRTKRRVGVSNESNVIASISEAKCHCDPRLSLFLTVPAFAGRGL